MIERIWVKNFRMLASNRIDLQPFAVLVGRNASGKSTFMSAFRFVSAFVAGGIDDAVAAVLNDASGSMRDLCFRDDESIAIALQIRLHNQLYRYEIEIAFDQASSMPVVVNEQLFSIADDMMAPPLVSFWSETELELSTIITGPLPLGWKLHAVKTTEKKDNYRSSLRPEAFSFQFDPTKSTLGQTPSDLQQFPEALAVRDFLRDGVTMIELDSHKLRMPSPPRSSMRLQRDGSNLGAAAGALKKRDPVAFQQWVEHVAGAVSGLTAIDTWERPEDRNVVLRATFAGEHAAPVPSWLLSDGTLRLMALSLLAYAEEPNKGGLLLIEEPENGLHPLAIQSVFDALSSMTVSQVFVATHSPVFLASVELAQALVFQRTEKGTARILRGSEVAELSKWRSTVQLADVFATGVLS